MPQSQFSSDARARLAAVEAVDLEAARPNLERIARLAQAAAGAPIVHISVMRAESLWLAGVNDEDLSIIPQRYAFADAVVEGGEALWIEDAAADARFRAGPGGAGAQRHRFFAGAPVRLSDGLCIGALMIIDRKPRPFDPAIAQRLAEFAALAAAECERLRTSGAAATPKVKSPAEPETLASIIEAAPVALAQLDLDLTVVRASQRFRERAANWIEGDLVGRPIYAIAPTSEQAWRVIRERCKSGQSLQVDRARFTRPDGVEHWVRWEISPWRDVSGEVAGILVMLQDITDMVGALEQSERSERRLKLATDLAELGVWEADFPAARAGSDDRLREPAAVLFAPTAGGLWEAIHPDDRAAASALWRKHLRDGTPFRSIFRLAQSDGAYRWVSMAAEGIRPGGAGPVERVVGVTRNIDKEKRAEAAMGEALEAAAAANRAKNEFLANMSHEIRTPLNGVMGIAGALAQTPLGPEQKDMVELIESSAAVLERLLGDVLDIARIEAGRLELSEEPFDLGRALRGAAALFERKATGKGLVFEVAIDQAAETTVCGDLVRLRQIISNLLSNAIKFTDAGCVALRTHAVRTGDAIDLIVTVSDTGIGFDAVAAARLFRRFQQADGSITRRFGGSGLGLAISRSIAEAMGGDLEAKSEPGKGSDFTLTVRLPCVAAVPAPAALAAPPAEQPAAAEPQSASRPRLLLAEDHPTNRKVVSLILELVGVDLTMVEDGKAALEASAAQDFDLILMDMQMPVMDGLTAIRAIREREGAAGVRRTPILTLTANALPDHVKASMEAGADGHLSKPIAAADLIGAVRRACGLYPASAAAAAHESHITERKRAATP